jgi:hypothetical protein
MQDTLPLHDTDTVYMQTRSLSIVAKRCCLPHQAADALLQLQ